MNAEIIEKLGIEETEPEAILECLTDLQLELDERIEQATDAGRLEALEAQLAEVKEQIKEVTADIEAKKNAPEAQAEEKVHGQLPIATEEAVAVVEKKKNFLVADDGTDEKAKEKAKKEEQKNQEKQAKEKEKLDKQHEEELKKQAKALQKDTKEQKKQEEIANQEQIKKDAEEAKTEADATAKNNPQTTMSKELVDGILAYKNNQFGEAYKKINMVANQGASQGLSKKELGDAEYMLGRMFQRGEGTTKSEERAKFWFETAANHDNVDGCLECGTYYATLNPANAKEDKSNLKKALQYYEKAAGLNSADGMTKYITLCEKRNQTIGFSTRLKAYKYCGAVKAVEPDNYLKTQWDKRARAILFAKGDGGQKAGMPNVIKSRHAGGVWQDIVAAIGAIIYIFGIACWIKEMSSVFCTTVFSNLPRIINGAGAARFILNNDFLQKLFFDWMLPFIPEFSLSMEWIVGSIVTMMLGNLLLGLSDYQDRSKLVNFICEARYFLGVVAVVFAAEFMLEGLTSGEFVRMIALTSLVVFVAKAPGALIRYFFIN